MVLFTKQRSVRNCFVLMGGLRNVRRDVKAERSLVGYSHSNPVSLGRGQQRLGATHTPFPTFIRRFKER
jgi:hypothetical protein